MHFEVPQALTFLRQAELAHDSSVFGRVRDVNALFNGGTASMLDVQHVLDMDSAAQLGIVSRQELFRTVNRLILAYQNIDANLRELQKKLPAVKAAPKPKTRAFAAAVITITIL
jgi:hypothetical protein